MSKTYSKAEDWINRIYDMPILSKAEYRKVQEELHEGLKTAPEEEKIEFWNSGVGETLSMLCQ